LGPLLPVLRRNKKKGGKGKTDTPYREKREKERLVILNRIWEGEEKGERKQPCDIFYPP